MEKGIVSIKDMLKEHGSFLIFYLKKKINNC